MPTSREIPEYYRGFDLPALTDELRNMDDAKDFAFCDRAICSPRTRNFILDFSDEDAWCSLDVEPVVLEKLLQKPRPLAQNVRWINVWLPSEQREALSVLAKHYDFSPRLLGLMYSELPRAHAPSNHTRQSHSSFLDRLHRRHDLGRQRRKSQDLDDSLLEISLSSEERGSMNESEISDRLNLVKNLNQYVLADDIWHYSSVDWGRRYVCIGYNALYSGDHSLTPPIISHSNLPNGKRVWQWLVLTDDRTIISITEDPFPHRSSALTMREHKLLATIRSNLIHVFRQCSKAFASQEEVASYQLPLRRRVGRSEEERVHRPNDMPGLLFYYLFDDSFTTYSIIARRRNRYAIELDRIRVAMLKRAELSHVDRLHHLGRQLAVLKRLYQGYILIIDRLLEPREPSIASLKASQLFQSQTDSLSSSEAQAPADSRFMIGVTLSSAARSRFERLKHSLHLYAISEIEECCAQKDALVMMNFNLIAIKESFSVERLTRITLLLGKATLLFMPVSLMTAYFSIQFLDMGFRVRTYWYWFAGIVAGSFIVLFGLGAFGGTTNYVFWPKSISRKVVGLWSRRNADSDTKQEC